MLKEVDASTEATTAKDNATEENSSRSLNPLASYGLKASEKREANTDVLFILKELERYFNESSEFVKSVMSSDEAINYQFAQGEAEMLKQAADKIAEVRNTVDAWYSEKY